MFFVAIGGCGLNLVWAEGYMYMNIYDFSVSNFDGSHTPRYTDFFMQIRYTNLCHINLKYANKELILQISF